MAIPEGHKANLQTLMNAVKDSNIAVLECTDKQTGKPVYVLCAVHFDTEKDEYVMSPIAKLFDGNPYEEVDPPK